MSGYKPRRPAQLKPEQIELIQGDANIADNSELAHASAQAVVPLSAIYTLESEAIARVQELIKTEGVDLLAESWVNSPATSLPGILWRGYLLFEWIRRFGAEVNKRYHASCEYFSDTEPEKLDLVLSPDVLKNIWAEVFIGDYRGDFAVVLRDSARFTDFLGMLVPEWIKDESHPLATAITLRDTAMLRVSQEFREAGELLLAGKLS